MYPSLSFRTFASEFMAAMAWVEGLGITINRARFGKYLQTVEAALTEPPAQHSGEEENLQGFAAIESGCELITLHQYLADHGSDQFKHRLGIYVEGAVLECEEVPASSSNKARNIGFELLLAATMARAGLDPQFPTQSDLTTQRPALRLECKRLQSPQKAEKNIRDAASKLQKRSSEGIQRVPGIIALAIGKIVHGGRLRLRAHSVQQGMATIDGVCLAFLREHEHVWEGWSKKHIQAVIAFYSGIIEVPSSNQWYWAYDVAIIPVSHAQTARLQSAINEAVEKLRVHTGGGAFLDRDTTKRDSAT